VAGGILVVDMTGKQYILSMGKQAGDKYADLYYEPDLEGDGVGDVVCGPFEWDRRKSNANLKEKGFSFFLARTVFYDRDWLRCGSTVVNGERREKVLGRPYGDAGAPVLVVIELALDGGRYRIISSWENENVLLENAYEKTKARKSASSSVSLDDKTRVAILDHVWKHPGGLFYD
jgi:uncharacterized DUF497 family protein